MWYVLQTVVPGNRNNVILQNLDPDTPYNIRVTALYADGAGGQLEGDGRTGMNYLISVFYVFQLMQRSFKDLQLSKLTDKY